MPSLGALARGHTLLIPQEHHTAFALLPGDMRRRTEHLLDRFEASFKRSGRGMIWFEHGSADDGSSGGCGITHAHIHMVPVDAHWARPPLPDVVAWSTIAQERWLDSVPGPGDYLAVGHQRSVSVAKVSRVESQLLRRWLAASLGAESWDWRSGEPSVTRLTEALRDFAADPLAIAP
jgi:diadenosine tetraphosphate (Ap4A) HIT family hydrolase